ncbi:MAG: hypothetical protein AB1861_29400 [Cyanobacteriota bacterium]
MNGQDSKQVRYYSEHFALMEMLQEALGGVSANKALAYLLSRYGYAILSELKGNSLPNEKRGSTPQERGTLPQKRGDVPQNWGKSLNTESLDPFQDNASSATEDCQNLHQEWGSSPQERGTLPQNRGDVPQNTKSEAELAMFDAMNAF